MPVIKRQYIVFVACPFGLGMTFSCHACVPDILFSYLANLHGYISLGQNKELIIFVDLNLIFKVIAVRGLTLSSENIVLVHNTCYVLWLFRSIHGFWVLLMTRLSEYGTGRPGIVSGKFELRLALNMNAITGLYVDFWKGGCRFKGFTKGVWLWGKFWFRPKLGV